MIRKNLVGFAVIVAVVGVSMSMSAQQPVPAKTPTSQPATGAADMPKVAAGSLMSVQIPRKVMADGQSLAAGTYMVQVTEDAPSKVVGQTVEQARFVEFLQGKTVKARALATVMTSADVKSIAKHGTVPAGSAKVEMLAGNEYLRVWVNKGGTNYLVNLPVEAK